MRVNVGYDELVRAGVIRDIADYDLPVPPPPHADALGGLTAGPLKARIRWQGREWRIVGGVEDLYFPGAPPGSDTWRLIVARYRSMGRPREVIELAIPDSFMAPDLAIRNRTRATIETVDAGTRRPLSRT